jgi:hypothetical protein
MLLSEEAREFLEGRRRDAVELEVFFSSPDPCRCSDRRRARERPLVL